LIYGTCSTRPVSLHKETRTHLHEDLCGADLVPYGQA